MRHTSDASTVALDTRAMQCASTLRTPHTHHALLWTGGAHLQDLLREEKLHAVVRVVHLHKALHVSVGTQLAQSARCQRGGSLRVPVTRRERPSASAGGAPPTLSMTSRRPSQSGRAGAGWLGGRPQLERARCRGAAA